MFSTNRSHDMATSVANFANLPVAIRSVGACLAFVFLTCPVYSQESASKEASPKEVASPKLERAEILTRQRELAQRYQLLEDKLFTLYGYEREKNPARARLLEKAYQRSRSAATSTQLRDVVATIENAKLRRAETEQAEVVGKLNELLLLLQSEDHSKRLKDAIDRYQDYLSEVEKLLRLQKSLRGQTDGGIDEQRIAKSESQAADRAAELSKNIRANEEASEEESAPEETPTDKTDAPQDADAPNPNPNPNPNGLPDKDSNSSAPATKPTDPINGEADPVDDANPVRKQVDIAEQRMRSAQKKLQEAQRSDAIEEMKTAEREIAKAKKQLEEVLRQMREEEIEQTLAKLEDRFRKMLEREIRVKQNTEKIAATATGVRNTDFDVQTGKLSTEQKTIAAQAAQALLLLADDGSSIAFLETVDEMQQDMQQIASRLSSAKVGEFTIDLETEVIETLNYLVSSLAQTQRDNEKEKDKQKTPPNGNAPPPQAGGSPLVGKIAELKMLRNLQERIYQRHQRYSRQLDAPDDIVGVASDPELIAALKRLTEKQKKLTTITQDIVESESP